MCRDRAGPILHNYFHVTYRSVWDAAKAQWIHLHLPPCRPGLESQEHHLCFYQFMFELCHVEKTKIKRGRDLPTFLKITNMCAAYKAFLKSNPLCSFFQGTQAYLSRSACYKHVTSMLKRLMSASSSAGIRPSSSATLPLKPGPPAPPDPNQLAPAEASEHADQV